MPDLERLQRRSAPLPLLGQSPKAPLVLMCDGSEQGDRQRMELEVFEDVVDRIGPFPVLVDTIERVTRSPHRQRRDFDGFAVGWDGGDARGNTKADIVDLAELLNCRVYLVRVGYLRIEDGFGIVEDYEHFL